MNNKFVNQTVAFFKGFSNSEIVVQAILIGLTTGFLVVLFKLSINLVFNFIQTHIAHLTKLQQLLIFPLITTTGGLISGILVFKFAPETRGSGIPYVKLTLARIGKGTRIRSIIVKFLAGVAGIGTGLSLGREGPSVQLGAGAGALIAKIFQKKGTLQHNLISAGAGAAIGATFNAPIAGTMFVLEELAQNFTASILFPVLIATVIASTVARSLLGANPSFTIPTNVGIITLSSLPVFIVLGILAGIFGVLFAKLIFLSNQMYDKIKIPNLYKPAIAGLLIGIFGLLIPQILGSGNAAVDALMQNKFTIITLIIIFTAKFIVTPLCFGSGAAGGIFLPMLMLGSFLGYITGLVSNHLGFSVSPVVLSLVGMGAFLSATARTPITAVVMVFEMTGDYNHILPIMFSVAIADLVAERLNHSPIYESLILKQGKQTDESKILSKTQVKTKYSSNTKAIKLNLTLQEALETCQNFNQGILPIINNKKAILGTITRRDIEDALIENEQNISIEKIMNPAPLTIRESDDLYKAYYLMHLNNKNALLVTDSLNIYKGIITREQICPHNDNKVNCATL